MAFEVLEHVEDGQSCLKEWWNILNGDGKLLISVPAHQSRWGENDVVAGHYRRYERAGMSNLLMSAGYAIQYFWNYAYPLSILLDVFLQRRVFEGSEMRLTKEELSKQSGIKRKRSLLNRLVASDFFIAPFLALQRCFLETDLSSAFMVVAEKMPNGRSG